MTAATDPMARAAAIASELTGPGGTFEIVEEDVLGARIPVMKNRRHSLIELFSAGEAHGDDDYLVTEDNRVTFRQHSAHVRSLAKALHEEYGVGPGDRVAILGANSIEWVETFWATQLLGAITVGFNAWWSPKEVEYGVEHSTPTVIVADAKRYDLAAATGVTVLRMEQDIPRLAAEHEDAPMPDVTVEEDDRTVILYTSGTSGRPKGAVHTHRNMLAVVDFIDYNDNLLAALFDQPVKAKRSYLVTSPLFHVASLHNISVPAMFSGSKVVIYTGKFEANRILAHIERERVTNWGAVPTMAHRLVDDGDFERYDTSSLTAFALASAPSSPAFQQRLRERVPFAKNSLVNSYGLTESSTGVAVATPMDLAANPGSVGRPTLTTSIEIRDPLNQRVPDGVEGEICVRAPYVMREYWGDPDATAAAIDDDRWLHTGDIGMIDDKGMLRMTTRRSDLILRGGENVYPVEIEQCVDECPGVQESAVVGVPHPDLGQEVVAVVVTDPGATVTEAQLREWVDERLAYYKRPARWIVTAEPLPRNATGKVIRREIHV